MKHRPKIEHGKPIPKRGSGIMKILHKLNVDDSFLWPIQDYIQLYKYARTAGIKIAIRKVSKKSFRIWRVK